MNHASDFEYVIGLTKAVRFGEQFECFRSLIKESSLELSGVVVGALLESRSDEDNGAMKTCGSTKRSK